MFNYVLSAKSEESFLRVSESLLLEANRQHKNLDCSLKIEVYPRRRFLEISKASDDLLGQFNISGRTSKRKRYKEQLSVLLSNLYVCWKAPLNPFLAIPMGKGKYSKGKRLNTFHLTYAGIKELVEALNESGFIEHHRGFFNGMSGRVTRIRGTQKLIYLFLKYKFSLDKVKIVPTKLPVVLKDGNKKTIDISRGVNRKKSKPIIDSTEQLNRFHSSGKWDLILPETVFIENYLGETKNKHLLNPLHNNFYRIFNQSFDKGGRFYGPWPQNIPRGLRQYIHINGFPSVEADFVAMHPTMLYIKEGKNFMNDPYLIEGYGQKYRKVIKKLFNMSLNASNQAKAFAAFRQNINMDYKFSKQFKECTQSEWLYPAYEAMCRHTCAH